MCTVASAKPLEHDYWVSFKFLRFGKVSEFFLIFAGRIQREISTCYSDSEGHKATLAFEMYSPGNAWEFTRYRERSVLPSNSRNKYSGFETTTQADIYKTSDTVKRYENSPQLQ